MLLKIVVFGLTFCFVNSRWNPKVWRGHEGSSGFKKKLLSSRTWSFLNCHMHDNEKRLHWVSVVRGSKVMILKLDMELKKQKQNVAA